MHPEEGLGARLVLFPLIGAIIGVIVERIRHRKLDSLKFFGRSRGVGVSRGGRRLASLDQDSERTILWARAVPLAVLGGPTQPRNSPSAANIAQVCAVWKRALITEGGT